MNTKRILIRIILFSSITAQAADLSKKTDLRKTIETCLTTDAAVIVEQYLCNGTIILDPTRDTTYNEFGDGYFIPVIYPHAKTPTPFLPQAVLEKVLANLVAGDIIKLPCHHKIPHTFMLAEDKNSNLKQIDQQYGYISKTLQHKGFTGEHAQMVRFMRNAARFSFHRGTVALLQKKDPDTLSKKEKSVLKYWNDTLDDVVHGKKKED